jgi:ubiquinone/menaquinone biosynthesis C-methylase UbiE
MGYKEMAFSQFAHPRGMGGRVTGWIMAHRASNVERNRWAVQQLDLAPTDHVLEVGFGPGIAVEALAHAVPHGLVHGIDASDVMLRRASKRNRRAIAAGRVELRCASAADIPTYEPLDAVLSVNSAQFWPDPRASIKELHARLHGIARPR